MSATTTPHQRFTEKSWPWKAASSRAPACLKRRNQRSPDQPVVHECARKFTHTHTHTHTSPIGQLRETTPRRKSAQFAEALLISEATSSNITSARLPRSSPPAHPPQGACVCARLCVCVCVCARVCVFSTCASAAGSGQGTEPRLQEVLQAHPTAVGR